MSQRQFLNLKIFELNQFLIFFADLLSLGAGFGLSSCTVVCVLPANIISYRRLPQNTTNHDVGELRNLKLAVRRKSDGFCW
jgi:hypothetical protein